MPKATVETPNEIAEAQKTEKKTVRELSALSKARNKVASTTTKLATLVKKREKLKADLAGLSEEFNQLNREYNAAKQERDNLEAELQVS